MSGTSSLLQPWKIPYTSLLFGRSKLSKGLSLVPIMVVYPKSCFCKHMQTTTSEVVQGSYIPTADANQQVRNKLSTGVENVGAFQKLPMVMPYVDILYSALRKAKRVLPTKGIANAAKRERNKGAKQLDALMKELAVPLRTYKETFPNKKYLHPYERSLIELTLGDGNYDEVLGKVEALRKKVVSVGKKHASICAKSLSKREAEERLTEGMKKLEEVFHQDGKVVDELLNIAKVIFGQSRRIQGKLIMIQVQSNTDKLASLYRNMETFVLEELDGF